MLNDFIMLLYRKEKKILTYLSSSRNVMLEVKKTKQVVTLKCCYIVQLFPIKMWRYNCDNKLEMLNDFIILLYRKEKKITYLLTELKKREIKLHFTVLTYLLTYLL